jgi:hypothetical protein
MIKQSWENYHLVDDRNFDALKKRLNKRFGGKDVREVYWGVTSLGKPFVIIEAIEPKTQDSEAPPKARKPISSGLTEE